MGHSIDEKVRVDFFDVYDFIDGVEDVKGCKCRINCYSVKDSLCVGYAELSKRAMLCDHWDVVIKGDKLEILAYTGDSGFRLEAPVDSLVSLANRKIYITSDDGVVIELAPVVGSLEGLRYCGKTVLYS